MVNIAGLIFDLDGVIVTTERNHFLAWQRTAKSLGIVFTEAHNENLKGVSRIDSLKKILELGSKALTKDEFDILLKSKNDFYLDSIKELNQSDFENFNKELNYNPDFEENDNGDADGYDDDDDDDDDDDEGYGEEYS